MLTSKINDNNSKNRFLNKFGLKNFRNFFQKTKLQKSKNCVEKCTEENLEVLFLKSFV